MTVIKRIEPPLALLSPFGFCYAHFLIDYGLDEHLFWVCFQDDTGECWTWKNTEIRIQNNPTIGRKVEYPKCKAALHASPNSDNED